MSLHSLPLELLEQIAENVEQVHRSSLIAFSLTCKACYKASLFRIFRKIKITVNNPKDLIRDVDKIVEALSSTDSNRHVQYIIIQGVLQLEGLKKKKNPFQPLSYTEWNKQHGHDTYWDELSIYSTSGYYVIYDEPVIKRFSEEDMAWAPVVGLLQGIPHLQDLVYDCQNQFPPSLLNALHEQHPLCRLHHLTFRFRTLLWGTPYPYEMELATSPSLYRVKVPYCWRDSEYEDDFNQDAMMELAGLAPNLKEIVIVNIFAYRVRSNYLEYRRRETWHGLLGFKSKTAGCLTSLTVEGCGRLQDWARHTDFSCLETLRLTGRTTGEMMEWVAQHHPLLRLRSLIVEMTRDGAFHEKPHYSENVISFFQSCGPLEELHLKGPIDSEILDAILYRHGQTLRELSLCPAEDVDYWNSGRERNAIAMEFTRDHILQLQTECPMLEKLTILIKRRRSTASETEIYNCFKGMESLRVLHLNLDCSDWDARRETAYNSRFDEEDQNYLTRYSSGYLSLRRGHIKELLINCAVDKALALSIWATISQNKKGRRLERLKLRPCKVGDWGPGTIWILDDIFKVLSRIWQVERPLRDDQDDVIVMEVGPEEREISNRYADIAARTEVGEIFRTIWPPKEGSKDWRDDWSSFPLQM